MCVATCSEFGFPVNYTIRGLDCKLFNIDNGPLGVVQRMSAWDQLVQTDDQGGVISKATRGEGG